MRSDGKITWLRDVLGDSRVSDDINTFASLGDRFSVTAGRTLARTGEYGREAFLIVSGRVEVRREGELVATLGPGDVAGELAVTGAVRRNADLVAASDVDLIVFDSASFRSALHLSSSLAAQVEGTREERTRVA
jgi:CRP/FNR family cyclic AMP-dependent transcriptional regulator